MRTLVQDLTYGARGFAKSPGFTAVVVVSIALGIAANSTVYSIVNSLVYASIPVREPDRLFAMNDGSSISWPNFVDIRRETTGKVFEGVCGFFPLVPGNIGGQGVPERVWGQLATANYLQVAGVQPLLGRFFLPEEDEVEGRNPVLMLGYGLWQRRFAGDPGIVGRNVLLNGRQYTVVGVAPAGFTGTVKAIASEFWAPVSMYGHLMPDLASEHLKDKRTAQWIMIDARLKNGVSREQAVAALGVLKRQIDETYFKNDRDRARHPWTLSRAGRIPELGNLMGLMAVLMVVVGLVLLVACANVANLMLARAAARRREVAIRLSIGAGRWRLVRQLLTESMLVALGGAAVGFGLAWLAAAALSRVQLPINFPVTFNFTPDWRVVAYTLALTVLTGVLSGLAPAIRSARTDLVSGLKDAGGGLGAGRRLGLRNLLVVAQVALSLVLLIGAGLFVRSLQKASSLDLGMKTADVATVTFDPKLAGYSPEKTRTLLAELRKRLAAESAVRAVSFVDTMPLSLGGVNFDLETSTEGAGKKSIGADIYRVGRSYFETMGIPLLRGRDFEPADREGAIILNEKAARELFPGREPVGATVNEGKNAYRVVGVVKTAKSRTLGEEPQACGYLSLEAAPEKVMSFFGISVLVKAGGAPGAQVRAAREILSKLDPTLAIAASETMQEHVDKARLVPRVCATLLAVCGIVGLMLAVVGLSGLLGYTVRSRTREIGIRVALGAERRRVVALIARQAMALVGAGAAIGLALSAAVTGFAASFLYGIGAHDAVTFVGIPLVLGAAALIGIIGPLRSAAGIEPIQALRVE